MAYGLKYWLEFTDNPTHGNTWRVEILKDSYVGSTFNIKGSGKPVRLSWKGGDLFQPIRGSECTLEMYSESNFYFQDFFTASELDFMCILKKNGSEYWQGTFVTESYNEPYTDTPYPVKLRFSDGLGILKYIKYEDAGAIKSGIASWISIVNFCLGKLPYSLNLVEIINILEEGTTDVATNGFLNTVNLNQDALTKYNSTTGETEGWKCFDVLKQMLIALGATMYQSNNKWYITRVEELENASPSYIEYNAGLATVASSGTTAIRQTITNTEAGITWLLQDADLSPSDVFDEISCKYTFGSPDEPSSELIKDWNFDLNATAIGVAAQFNHWEVSDIAPGGSPTGWVKDFIPLNGAGYTFEQDENALSFHPKTVTTPIAEVLDTSLYMRALEYPGATYTKDNLVINTNDRLKISFGPFRTWYYIGNYHDSNGIIHTEALAFVYEVEFYFKIRIGAYYLEQDTDGNLSWGTTVTSTVSKKIRLTWTDKAGYIATHGTSPALNIDLDALFQNDAVTFDTPVFPVNALTNMDITMYYPVTPVIWFQTSTTAGLQVYSLVSNIQAAAISCQLVAGNNTTFNEKQTIVTSDSLRDRKKEVVTMFGDGPHRAINRSFLVDDPATVGSYKDSQNWYSRGDTIDDFTVTSVGDQGGNTRPTSSTDTHTFVVGNYVIGSAFTNFDYNTYQRVTNVVNTQQFDTDNMFISNDSGTLKGYISAGYGFVTGPYSKYLGAYRRELNGTLFGELDFYKTIVSRDSKIYMKSSMNYDVKSSQYSVELLELLASTTTQEIKETKGGTQVEVVTTTTGSVPTEIEQETTAQVLIDKKDDNTTNINLKEKSGQITEVNDTIANQSNYINYPV